jgi:hypothetical protein
MSKYRRNAGLTLIVSASLLVGQLACVQETKEMHERRDRAELDLDSISESFDVPTVLEKVHTEKSVDNGKVAIFDSYKTSAHCEDVGQHFRSRLIEKGWDRQSMTVRSNRGGMDTISYDFRNGDYLVSVECQTDIAADNEKSIVISYSWGLRP